MKRQWAREDRTKLSFLLDMLMKTTLNTTPFFRSVVKVVFFCCRQCFFSFLYKWESARKKKKKNILTIHTTIITIRVEEKWASKEKNIKNHICELFFMTFRLIFFIFSFFFVSGLLKLIFLLYYIRACCRRWISQCKAWKKTQHKTENEREGKKYHIECANPKDHQQEKWEMEGTTQKKVNMINFIVRELRCSLCDSCLLLFTTQFNSRFYFWAQDSQKTTNDFVNASNVTTLDSRLAIMMYYGGGDWLCFWSLFSAPMLSTFFVAFQCCLLFTQSNDIIL